MNLTVTVADRPIAELLSRANALQPFAQATAILDNGCGPGPIMTRLLQEYTIPGSCQLTCADFSAGMVRTVDERKAKEVGKDKESPWARVETLVQDATNLNQIADSSKSHILAGWVYFMTPDPAKCLTESRRALRDGGVLSCSSWKTSQWMELMNLYTKVRPDKQVMSIPEAWRETATLKGELEKAGFKQVECVEVPTRMDFQKADTLVDFMTDRMPHMKLLTADMSVDEKQKFKVLMKEELLKMCPHEPGTLHGTSLVAVGVK